jgi:drug/metabolite transporter (DMT)-like permease
MGLAHASPFAFLFIRFVIALCGLILLVPLLKLKLPKGGKPMLYAMATGVVLLGAYQIFYLLALDLKVTPGVMATIMGVQPILTVVIMERQRSASRMFGLSLGLAGLIMVVYQGIGPPACRWPACSSALALASMTLGSIMQKRITDNPLGTLPVQYLAGLLLCGIFVPFQPFHFEHSAVLSCRCCGWAWWSRYWRRCCSTA